MARVGPRPNLEFTAVMMKILMNLHLLRLFPSRNRREEETPVRPEKREVRASLTRTREEREVKKENETNQCD
jgi:hypothetical protein